MSRMATTPPAASRARTPPTPLHGPQYDSYEPYSPRRSRRSTAHSNPYSSFNGARSPKAAPAHNITPPTTAKRARFSHAPPQLSSPPSSPASPIQRHTLHKTPRRLPAASGTLSDSDGAAHSLAASSAIDPTSMLPTPSKTPKKRAATALNARILNFHPGSPSDVMPSARKIKSHNGRHRTGGAGFELYDSDGLVGGHHGIEIYTDPNARVPEMDESEDNPFIGPKRVHARPQARRSRKSVAEQEQAQRMNDAVRRGEGLTYVFRGRTIFRKFEDGDGEEVQSAGSEDLGNTSEQQRLKHSAGANARRPLTRSAIKPRLLFPSQEQRLERERQAQEADEEAVTDIEMSNAPSPVNDEEEFSELDTPPAAKGAPRRTKINESLAVPGLSDGRVTRKGKSRSPFEAWPRTKAGVSKKRASEATERKSGNGKRTRSSVTEGSG